MKEIISYGRFQCKELTPHKNRGMEITYIEKGMMEWIVEGVPEKVESESIFFTLPWQVHGSLNPREPNNTIWHLLFHLEKDYSRPRKQFKLAAGLNFTPAEMKLLSTAFCSASKHSFRATPAIRWLMPALINELQSAHKLREAHTRTLLRAVLVELKRIVTGEVVDTEKHSRSEQRVEELISQLPASCDQRWTLAGMASQCGIQRTQIGNVFQKLTGCTPMEYLSRIRIERAKTLLRETDMKVINIALECGFSSSQYFANTFKHSVGMTPSEYRVQCIGLSAAELRAWKDIDFRSEQEERQRIQTFSAD